MNPTESKLGRWIQRMLGRSDIYFDGSLYMRRWRLIHNRWFGVRLHQIMRSDKDRELHDHPFSFLSLILTTGYIEWLPCAGQGDHCVRSYRPLTFNFKRAEDLHRLEIPEGRTTWTLVVRGPVRREWGFMTDNGWVHWSDFTTARQGLGEAAGEYATRSSI